MTKSTPTVPPSDLRQLESPGAAALAELMARFEDLQTVLRCCERLVSELATDGERDEVVLEGVWTMALLSYARCFSADGAGPALTEADITRTQSSAEVLTWHRVLMQLREHYADPSANPREKFLVGVTQNEDGTASGVAITSARQPLVDDITVRQTGAIAFGLSSLVNDRVAKQQMEVFGEVRETPKAALDKLARLDVAESDAEPS